MTKVKKLKRDINKKFADWDERSSFTMKGVKGLSVADMDAILLYAEQYERQGSFRGLMEPRGAIKAVLDAYGIKDTNSGGLFW